MNSYSGSLTLLNAIKVKQRIMGRGTLYHLPPHCLPSPSSRFSCPPPPLREARVSDLGGSLLRTIVSDFDKLYFYIIHSTL